MAAIFVRMHWPEADSPKSQHLRNPTRVIYPKANLPPPESIKCVALPVRSAKTHSMASLHSLWALLVQLGLEPGVLLAKAGEKATLYVGGKAAKLAGKQVSAAANAILAYWNSTVEASFPAYLQSRLTEVDARERPGIIGTAFSDWIASRTAESAELSRLLFRLIYLRALIDHCIELPVLAQSRLGLDDVWVPQTFRQLLPETLRQRQAGHARFFRTLKKPSARADHRSFCWVIQALESRPSCASWCWMSRAASSI